MRDRHDSGTSPSAADSYRQGMKLYHQGLYSQAAEALSAVPDDGSLEGAIAKYYRGMSCRALGTEALSQDQYDQAERHLAEAAQLLGRDGNLSGYLACLYARTGRLADCLRQTEKALTDTGDDARTWLRHAQAQWRSGGREEAQITLRQALRQFGRRADLHNTLGLFLAAQGRLAQARDCFAQAIQADGFCADAHYYHALAAAAMHDTLDAVHSLQQAYELRPSDLGLARQLALAAKAANEQGHHVSIRLPEATAPAGLSQAEPLVRYLITDGDFVDALLSLPPSEIDAELFGVLAAALQKALAQHGDYADLHLRASAVQSRLGQTDKAVHHARAAVAINGRYVRGRLHLAKLCTEVGQEDEAIEHLQQAIAAGADWPDVHCTVGELMLPRGRTQEARRHLTRALQLNPNYDRAAKALSALAA
ncbi:MAG: tetratricopeptide repeat protein [Phycisphaerae bacterium]